MTELDRYLAQHYLNEAQLIAAAAIGRDDLATMIGEHLVPAPSYVVSGHGTLTSFVFGELPAPGATPGRYFHPAQLAWIARARAVRANVPAAEAAAQLQATFRANFAAALATLNLTTWRMADSFDDTGAPVAAGLLTRTESAWMYFLNGTSGLCVANPVSEAHIAVKEVLQEKLTHLSENGGRTAFSAGEATAMHALIDAYAAAAMCFSPVEYARSSRKRLVEDMRAALPAPALAG